MFGDVYRGKRVVVTGHTGFKGSWLTVWLAQLGAEVIGISKGIPTEPAMFDALRMAERISHRQVDIRDAGVLREIICGERPDFVFHLAAQAIVSTSYADPVETMSTNVIGTMNVLEALRGLQKSCVAVLVTSDKAYDNVEWAWGYRETDRLGGKDIYSGSKAAAELVIRSYVQSFFGQEQPVRIGIGRAGNVIGGGDWGKDRIVADCMRSWSEGRQVEIRNPRATRPWQHVLEPLSGYLTLGQALARNRELHGEAYNFGPRAEQNRTVVELLTDLSRKWGIDDATRCFRTTENIPFSEAGLLKLNCDKALFDLEWQSNLDFSETVSYVGAWYAAFYRDTADMYALSVAQVVEFEQLAKERNRVWARG